MKALADPQAAAGNPLPKRQDELVRTGWAFEARIYAERPRSNFLPGGGPLLHMRAPMEKAESLRVETGVEQGDEVTSLYDPMISKLVVHGLDRDDALRKLRNALDGYEIVGPSTNIEFLSQLASHPSFAAGDVHTAFIGQHHDQLFPPIPEPTAHALAQAALALDIGDRPFPSTPFTALASARFGFGNDTPSRSFAFVDGSSVSVSPGAHALATNVRVTSSSGTETTYANATLAAAPEGRHAAWLGDARSVASVVPSPAGDKIHVFTGDARNVAALEIPQPQWLVDVLGKRESAANSVKAPMPATVTRVSCEVGQVVEAGQAVRRATRA